MNNIGSIIRAYRKEAGLTSKELAKLIGYTQGTISHIETGKRNPSNRIMKEIIDILSIPESAINGLLLKNNHKYNSQYEYIGTKGYMTFKTNDKTLYEMVIEDKSYTETTEYLNKNVSLSTEERVSMISRILEKDENIKLENIAFMTDKDIEFYSVIVGSAYEDIKITIC